MRTTKRVHCGVWVALAVRRRTALAKPELKRTMLGGNLAKAVARLAAQ